MSIEAMKQALEALEVASSCVDSYYLPEGKILLPEVESAITALRTAIEQAEKCRRDNPLGGPAKVFDAMANSIRAGDDYHQVLRQYGFVEAAEKQEPVGMVKVLPLGEGHKPMHWADWTDADNPPPEDTPLYNTPPAAPVQEQFGPQEILQMIVDRALEKSAAQRQWVGLTDEEIDKTHETQVWDARRSYARAIEAKLREKNGARSVLFRA